MRIGSRQPGAGHFRKFVLTPFSLLIGCVALAGCAALECDTNWYETGRRDGLLGAETQVEYYSGQCSGNVDVLRYLDGWNAGQAMRPRISVM